MGFFSKLLGLNKENTSEAIVPTSGDIKLRAVHDLSNQIYDGIPRSTQDVDLVNIQRAAIVISASRINVGDVLGAARAQQQDTLIQIEKIANNFLKENPTVKVAGIISGMDFSSQRTTSSFQETETRGARNTSEIIDTIRKNFDPNHVINTPNSRIEISGPIKVNQVKDYSTSFMGDDGNASGGMTGHESVSISGGITVIIDVTGGKF